MAITSRVPGCDTLLPVMGERLVKVRGFDPEGSQQSARLGIDYPKEIASAKSGCVLSR